MHTNAELWAEGLSLTLHTYSGTQSQIKGMEGVLGS